MPHYEVQTQVTRTTKRPDGGSYVWLEVTSGSGRLYMYIWVERLEQHPHRESPFLRFTRRKMVIPGTGDIGMVSVSIAMLELFEGERHSRYRWLQSCGKEATSGITLTYLSEEWAHDMTGLRQQRDADVQTYPLYLTIEFRGEILGSQLHLTYS